MRVFLSKQNRFGLRQDAPEIDWVIGGGESGHHRRDCGVEAIEDVAHQCLTAGVPCFVKQDCALRPGQRGRISKKIWELKEFPEPNSLTTDGH